MQRIPPPQKWLRPPLGAKARIGDAFIANVSAAVVQIRANRPGAAGAPRPEHLHQLRVGIRRLRCTLRACRTLVRRKEAAQFERRLRSVLRALGEARDWDVFEAAFDRPGLRRLARYRSGAARRRARAAARSAGFRFLPEEALAWARGRPWRREVNPGEPMIEFARRSLERAHRGVAKAAEGIDWRDAPRRHRVRIRVKRLRYAAECFAAGWPAPATQPFLRKLRRLQEVLGELNDLSVQRRLLTGIAKAGSVRQVDAALRMLAQRERSLIAKPRRAWREFNAVGPFWR